jgi:hypothetical protein
METWKEGIKGSLHTDVTDKADTTDNEEYLNTIIKLTSL